MTTESTSSGITESAPKRWTLLLATTKRYNGRWREWVGVATDEDDAIEQAEAANPGWAVHTIGNVEGVSGV